VRIGKASRRTREVFLYPGLPLSSDQAARWGVWYPPGNPRGYLGGGRQETELYKEATYGKIYN
jgi:hypothetical protein